MSLPLRPSLLPKCTSCTRRITNLGLHEWRPTSQQQIRGKKKLANIPSTVTVRLLKDVKTFGRRGAYVPISVGQMRNDWFPRRVAEYVTPSQTQEIKTRNTTTERDFQFGVTDPSEDPTSTTSAVQQARKPLAASAAAKAVDLDRLTPERSADLLSRLLPTRLTFHRQAIESVPAADPATPPPQTHHNQQRGGSSPRTNSSAAADLLFARSSAAPPQKPSSSSSSHTPIYGSVSTGDVATAMKAVLAENEEASKVVFGEEDVRFVDVEVEGQTERLAETDRVKHLGEFEVEVRIRGGGAAVKRVVRVVAQEGAVQ